MTAARKLDELKEEIPQHVFRRVERALYDYPVHRATLQSYPVDRSDVLLRYREWPPSEGHAEGKVSDRTGESIIRLDALEEQRAYAKLMVSMIDSVYEILSDEQQKLVKLKYWSRDRMTNEQIAAYMNMSRWRWYRMRDEIIRAFALRMGLLV